MLGLFVSVSAERVGVPDEVRLLVAVGFLGAYTTFSTLTVASVQLADSGDLLRGALNIVGSIVVGLVAAYLGIIAGRAI